VRTVPVPVAYASHPMIVLAGAGTNVIAVDCRVRRLVFSERRQELLLMQVSTLLRCIVLDWSRRTPRRSSSRPIREVP